jgi:hypothetical protein
VFNNNLPVSSLFCKISLLSLPHCLPTCIHCPFCSSAFCAPCAIPLFLHYFFPFTFSCCTTPLLLHTCITPPQQLPHHFSFPCSFHFCAPYACNVHHTFSYSHRVNLFHISSALSDHHGNPSASLAIFPRVQHHWMSC